jgi:protein-disulfide isomerase
MNAGTLLRIIFLFALAAVATLALRAQTPSQSAILRPPEGAKVALVEFADLECPDCARAASLLDEAEKTYKIPVVVYDFPLPQHQWAFEASVFAQYFRTKSPVLEWKYRLYIYQNQPAITAQNLRSYVEKFAAENKVVVPFVVDPQGKLAAAVKASKDKGVAVSVNHTPTIYVVTTKPNGPQFAEVTNRNDLFAMIDQAKEEAK